MNAGVLTVWAVTIILILLFTGWRRTLFDGMSRSSLLVLAGGLILSLPFTLPVNGDFSVHLSLLWLGVWSAVTMRVQLLPGPVFMLIGGSVVATLGWFGLERMYRVDPVFFILHPEWDGIILVGLFTGLLTWRFDEQFIIVTLSLVCAETARLVSDAAFGAGLLAGWGWWDRFLAAMILAKLTGASCRLLLSMRARRLVRDLQDEGGGHP